MQVGQDYTAFIVASIAFLEHTVSTQLLRIRHPALYWPPVHDSGDHERDSDAVCRSAAPSPDRIVPVRPRGAARRGGRRGRRHLGVVDRATRFLAGRTRMDIEVVLKRFESPDEVRVMTKGKFELVHIGGMTIGRATYEPGWKWSTHVGPLVGAARCDVEHVGLVVSGTGDRGVRGWPGVRADGGESVLHSACPARQLGGRRSAVRVTALHGRGDVRKMSERCLSPVRPRNSRMGPDQSDPVDVSPAKSAAAG